MRATMEEASVTRLLLVRHGESTWNRESRMQGQSDSALSDLGRRQAERLGMRLAREPITAAYASDLQRAYETAKIALAGRGIEVVPEPALREIRHGVWEGLILDEVDARYPGMREWFYSDPAERAVPGGETMREVQSRACAAIGRIIATHPDETVLIATHGGTLKSMLCHWLELPLSHYRSLPSANCCLYVVEARTSSGQANGSTLEKRARSERDGPNATSADPRGSGTSTTDFRVVVHHDVAHCEGLEAARHLTETAD